MFYLVDLISMGKYFVNLIVKWLDLWNNLLIVVLYVIYKKVIEKIGYDFFIILLLV